MVVVDLDIPKYIYKHISNKKKISYEDLIKHYEDSSFDYEKVGMNASDFKSYLLNEISNG